MAKELRERDAEIARLTEQNHFFQVQYQDEAGINALSEQLVAAKAEIERLATLEVYLRNELNALRGERDVCVAAVREAALSTKPRSK